MNNLKRVGIIGAGPSGLYAAKKILAVFPKVKINFFERYEQPFGLLRYGVAPDHTDIKQAMDLLRKSVLNDSRVTITFGIEVKRSDLDWIRDQNQAVIIANGASIPDKASEAFTKYKNCFTGLQMAEWYNGVSRETVIFDETIKNIVVIGLGDVAMDVTRILLKEGREFSGNPYMVNKQIKSNLNLCFF